MVIFECNAEFTPICHRLAKYLPALDKVFAGTWQIRRGVEICSHQQQLFVEIRDGQSATNGLPTHLTSFESRQI